MDVHTVAKAEETVAVLNHLRQLSADDIAGHNVLPGRVGKGGGGGRRGKRREAYQSLLHNVGQLEILLNKCSFRSFFVTIHTT